MRFLKQLGANYVFDTTFARDFALTERYFTACAMGLACTCYLLLSCTIYTVSVERFTRLNFRNFEEYCESFSMNIYKLCIMVLFKYFKCKAPQKFPFIGFESIKVYPNESFHI